jgi:hypothetical protein
MSNATMEDIARNDPVDKTAARVVTSGVHYQLKGTKVAHWEACPPLRKFRGSRSPTDRNLAGKRFGSFRVMGIHALGHKVRKWVVRCACGRYELRSGRAICNPKNTEDCCVQCRRHKTIVRRGSMEGRQFYEETQEARR